MQNAPSFLVIACGALAREIVALRALNHWSHMAVQCLPADLHNRPEKITDAVRAKIHANRGQFQSIFVAYADCGTGGALDAMLQVEGIERLPGAHCYEFFAGAATFAHISEAELGTFYLTDFLLTHFERLIIHGLGLDRNPQLLPLYFGNYTKLTYLAQVPSEQRLAAGQAAAKRLGLRFDYLDTAYGELASSLADASQKAYNLPTTSVISWQN
jgi:hypothetical protein